MSALRTGRLTFNCKMLDGREGQFEIEDCGENPRCYHGRPGEEPGKPFKGWMTWMKVGEVEDYSLTESDLIERAGPNGDRLREAQDVALLFRLGVDASTVDWEHPL